MKNSRMKRRQNLAEHKKELTEGVRKTIQQSPQNKRSNWKPFIVGGLALILAVLLFVRMSLPDENNLVMEQDGEFSFGFLEHMVMNPRESYYFVTPVNWTGEDGIHLTTLELVTANGEPVTYEGHGIAYEVFGAVPDKKTGIYTGEIQDDILDFSMLEIDASKTSKVVFRFVLRENVEKNADLRVKITYENNGDSYAQIVEWATLQNISSNSYTLKEYGDQFRVSADELLAYEAMKDGQGVEALRNLEPVSIAKLYCLAGIEGEYDLQYNFYTDRSEYITRTREEDAAIPVLHRSSVSSAIQLLNDVAQGEFIEMEDGFGYIAFTQAGVDMQMGFQLIQNDEGIWQVAFMPLQ